MYFNDTIDNIKIPGNIIIDLAKVINIIFKEFIFKASTTLFIVYPIANPFNIKIPIDIGS